MNQLVRGLGTWDAAALVIGPVIGTGIFLKTAAMAQYLGHPGWVFLAWIVAAVLSYAGALSYAELGSRFPQVGGEYAYLREGYGDFVAFLYGWTRILVSGPASIAAYSVGAATFLSGYVVVPQVPTALAFIAFFTALNCLTVSASGTVQTLLTFAKLLLIAGIVSGVLIHGARMENLLSSEHPGTWAGWSAFGSALIAALWAFDGWNNLPMVGSEVRNAQRALPIALALGMIAIAGAYLLANLAYFLALPFSTILTANSTDFPEALPVATLAAQTFLGHEGVAIMSVIFAVSALGAMHGSILTCARVPYAMAMNGLMARSLTYVHPQTRSPVAGVLFESLMACILALSGTFDQLTDAVVFSSWIFYALAAASLIRFRREDAKSGTRPVFLAPGYPYVPFVFVCVSIALLINTVYSNPKPSLLGLGTIILGVPAYFYFRSVESGKSP